MKNTLLTALACVAFAVSAPARSGPQAPSFTAKAPDLEGILSVN
jgi:hypothetical protein